MHGIVVVISLYEIGPNWENLDRYSGYRGPSGSKASGPRTTSEAKSQQLRELQRPSLTRPPKLRPAGTRCRSREGPASSCCDAPARCGRCRIHRLMRLPECLKPDSRQVWRQKFSGPHGQDCGGRVSFRPECPYHVHAERTGPRLPKWQSVGLGRPGLGQMLPEQKPRLLEALCATANSQPKGWKGVVKWRTAWCFAASDFRRDGRANEWL